MPAAGAGAVCVDGVRKGGNTNALTIADARHKAAVFFDIGEPGDSVGLIQTFDQPLLDEGMKIIGKNSGTCIRTRVAHSFQCQWTLNFNNGSIQAGGREFDQGKSTISIIGGTGVYAGISVKWIRTIIRMVRLRKPCVTGHGNAACVLRWCRCCRSF